MQTEEPRSTRKNSILSCFLIVVILTIAGAALGYLHVSSQPQKWKVTAKFEPPKIANLGNYFSLYSTYTLVQNDGKTDPALEKNVIEETFIAFKHQLISNDNRQQFLSNHTIVKQIADVHNQPLNEVVNQLSAHLQFNDTQNVLSLPLVNPKQAEQILNDFIALSTEQSRKMLYDDLIAKWKFLFQNVKQSAEANLGESWKGKLNLMRSVQPLDNQLIPYYLAQKATAETKAELPTYFNESIGIGGSIGLLLGLLFVFTRRK